MVAIQRSLERERRPIFRFISSGLAASKTLASNQAADCGVCRYLRPSELQRLQHDHAAEERDRVCAPGPVRRGRIGRIGGARKRRPVLSDPL